MRLTYIYSYVSVPINIPFFNINAGQKEWELLCHQIYEPVIV